MAGRHDKPSSPHSFHPNSLLARHHATVSIIITDGKKVGMHWNRPIGSTFLSGVA